MDARRGTVKEHRRGALFWVEIFEQPPNFMILLKRFR